MSRCPAARIRGPHRRRGRSQADTALIVDHRLQPDSGRVAATARDQALAVGCVDAQVLYVDVGTAGGPEAAARTARYVRFDGARGNAPVLLAHTLDDQAETVLLGLGRGSGSRSIAGMRPCDPPWYRPLLSIRRTVTHAACTELGLSPWQDPHNTDRRFTRTRLRRGAAAAGGGARRRGRRSAGPHGDCASRGHRHPRRAGQRALADVGTGGELDVAQLAALPEAVRRRVIRGWLLAGGASGLTDKQIRGVDTLVTAWRGQGGVAVGSPLRSQRLIAGRRDGMLTLHTQPV